MAKCLKHVSTLDSKTTNSSGSSTVEKSVLLIADSNDHQPENTGWYVAKVSSPSPSAGEHRNKKRKRNSKRRFHPRGTLMDPIWKSDSPFRCCFAVIGSTIYKIGGGKDSYHTPTWDIYEADTGHLRKWNRVSSRMLSKRNNARAVVVHEKIYVFGGFMPRDSTSTSSNSPRPRLPWAEVYDPKLNLWSPLREPPSRLDSGLLFAAYDHNSSKKESKNKIIVGSGSDPLLSYDVTNNTWEIIDDKFEILTNFTCPVLLDNRLYWIGYKVDVYDLKLKEMYEGPIIGDYDNFDPDLREYPDCSDYQRVFFHIVGDVFGFCWLHCLSLGDQICCTTIRISSKVIDRRRNGCCIESFKARCLSTQRYWVDQRVDFLGGLLL